MSVLEAPQTWIAAAAVLVVIAVVLIALAPRRRRNAFVGSAGAAGSPVAASAPDDDVDTTPVGPIAAPFDGGTAGHDGASGRTGDWFRPDQDGHPDRTPQPDADEDATGETVPAAGPAPTPVPAPAAAEASAATDARDARNAPDTDTDIAEDDADDADTVAAAERQPARPSPRYVAVADPARTGDRAKDRLLAVLLADPDGAVDVVAAMAEDGEASGTAAASLLRAGLTPRQVAVLCGVDEGALATLVARDLGLLARSLRDQDGRSRTEEPGRAWASAGSEPLSTTPTTG